MRPQILIVLLLIAGAFLAGCTTMSAEGRDIAQDTIRAHFEHNGDWTPGSGCYENVRGYAYNPGNSAEDTLVLTFNLVNNQTSTIRDSRSVFIGTIGAGQSATFETDMNGECLEEYRVMGTILW